jgi:hypothetical protein
MELTDVDALQTQALQAAFQRFGEVHREMEAEPRAQPADRCDEGKRRGPNKYDVNLGGDTVETIVVDGTEHPARMIRRYR